MIAVGLHAKIGISKISIKIFSVDLAGQFCNQHMFILWIFAMYLYEESFYLIKDKVGILIAISSAMWAYLHFNASCVSLRLVLIYVRFEQAL